MVVPDNPYEAIKVIEAWGLNFSLGNAVKYISRAGKKSKKTTIEDLKKAATYIQFEIRRLENDSNRTKLSRSPKR
jgi:translation initiation factor 2B subunit (eIF-2B alpha/beta/delta family)